MTQSRQIPEVGTTLQGRVVRILENGAIVDIGQGVRGMVERSQITWRNKRPNVAKVLKVGDELKLIVTKIKRSEKSKTIFISLDALQCQPNPWPALEQTLPVGSSAKAIVRTILPFGLEVEIENGFHGLVHISEVSWIETEPDLKNTFSIGDQLDVVIQSIDVEKQRIYASHRLAIENPWPAIETDLTLGSRAKGKVVGFHSSGARIQFENGLCAVIPNAELSWVGSKPNARDVLRLGESVDVIIQRLDKEKRQIYVSRRQAVENPWATFAKEFPIGRTLVGLVNSVCNYGVFIILPNGLVGLLHNKEIPVGAPPILIGHSIGVKILDVDKDKGRLSLGYWSPPKPDAST